MGQGMTKILPGLFLGGEELIVMGNYQLFAENDIGCVVSLCDSTPEDFLPLERMHIRAVDEPSFDLVKHFDALIRFIHNARRRRVGVFVHCKAGMSRSATVVIAYVMAELGVSSKEAFEIVRNAKGDICPNIGFQRQLILFGRRQSRELHRYLQCAYGSALFNEDTAFLSPTPNADSKCNESSCVESTDSPYDSASELSSSSMSSFDSGVRSHSKKTAHGANRANRSRKEYRPAASLLSECSTIDSMDETSDD